MCVFSVLSQMTLLIVTVQDAREHVDTVCLIMESRFGGEDKQVGAVLPPANLFLWKEETSYTVPVRSKQIISSTVNVKQGIQLNFLLPSTNISVPGRQQSVRWHQNPPQGRPGCLICALAGASVWRSWCRWWEWWRGGMKTEGHCWTTAQLIYKRENMYKEHVQIKLNCMVQ